MANDPKKPEMGEVHIDASDLLTFLKDLPEGATRGMRTAQDGFGEVLQEIMSNQAGYGDKAGITTSDINELVLANDRIGQIDQFLPAAQKLVEMLEETRAQLDDQRQRAVNGFARSVEDRAKSREDGTTLLAKYQKTRVYRSAIGVKAAKTRKKNEAAAETGEAQPGSAATTG
ncbi:MAG TPA: hypothetical protein VLS89_15425 [Candidatus Nanopelagicales bacterium]|nr:hypothetical protein [Candidatus Nanopelagicales bacterium]